ncbi:DUF4145 domain-containing protein [Streptococcus danieliae]|nr:DUF4145 domain-containing protein [Streptococcus danieliae]
METSIINIQDGYGSWMKIEIPSHCPNCGIGNNPTTEYNSELGNDVKVYSHYCVNCQKHHYTIQDKAVDKQRALLMFYPRILSENIPEVFLKHAPRFVEFYSEAIEAEKMNLTNLAATGYRSAIECLVKDYALSFELDSEEEISKLNFNNAINKYVQNDELLSGTIHWIRKVGNNYTHWDKSTDITLSSLKSYVDIILSIFEAKFKMKALPEI